MIQTALIQNAHKDLVTDACYDFYGLRLATAGLDQRVKVWALDESAGTWSLEEEWKAHDAAITKLSWAHPEFGPIIASSSFDRSVKIWEEIPVPASSSSAHGDNSLPGINGLGTSAPGLAKSGSGGVTGAGAGGGASGRGLRWVERTTLAEAKGSVRIVEFAPRHFGLKIASISTDNILRIYTCLEQPNLASWTVEEYDIASLPIPSAVAPSNISGDNNSSALPGTGVNNTTGPSGVGASLSDHPSSTFGLGGASSSSTLNFGAGLPNTTSTGTGGFGANAGTSAFGSGPTSAFGAQSGLGLGTTGQGTSQVPGIGQNQPNPFGGGAGVGTNTTSGFGASGVGAGGQTGTGGDSGMANTSVTGGSAFGTGSAYARPGVGIREADGGWCVSWCKEHYWGEVIAVGWGVGGVVKIVNFNPSRRAQTLLALEAPSSQPSTAIPPSSSSTQRPSSHRASSTTRSHAHPTQPPNLTDEDPSADDPTINSSTNANTPAVTSVAWAPSCGRSFHLVATGSRDGKVRVWKVRPGAAGNGTSGVGALGSGEGEGGEANLGGMQPTPTTDADGKYAPAWSAVCVAEFDDHGSCVGRVEWNVTGTILSSAGNDGRVRLWKQTVGGVWRAAGTISVEQSEERGTAGPGGLGNGDVDME